MLSICIMNDCWTRFVLAAARYSRRFYVHLCWALFCLSPQHPDSARSCLDQQKASSSHSALTWKWLYFSKAAQYFFAWYVPHDLQSTAHSFLSHPQGILEDSPLYFSVHFWQRSNILPYSFMSAVAEAFFALMSDSHTLVHSMMILNCPQVNPCLMFVFTPAPCAESLAPVQVELDFRVPFLFIALSAPVVLQLHGRRRTVLLTLDRKSITLSVFILVPAKVSCLIWEDCQWNLIEVLAARCLR